MNNPYIIQMLEYVEICGEKHLAKIDTGASRSSIDKKLAEKLGLNEIIKEKEIKSSHGKSVRQIISTNVKIGKRNIPTSFTLAERDELKFDLILGKNFLWRGFLIDTRRSDLERKYNESSSN